MILSTPGLSNGLGESVPFRFTHKDKLKMLELQLLKESGFYDSQAGAGGTAAAGDTIINGDQINCMVQSTAMANTNTTGLEAVTGSYTGVSEVDIESEARANDAESWDDGDGDLDIAQTNEGNQDSTITGTEIGSDVGTFNGGGTSDQSVTSTQTADNSTFTSTVDNVTVCDGMTVN